MRFKERLSTLVAHLDALQAQDPALAHETLRGDTTTPDTTALHAVADQLAHVIANGDTHQAGTLLCIIIAYLRAMEDELFPMAELPDEWKLDDDGSPALNWVAALHRSRRGS